MNIEVCNIDDSFLKIEFHSLDEFICKLGPLAEEPVTMSEHISIMNNKL